MSQVQKQTNKSSIELWQAKQQTTLVLAKGIISGDVSLAPIEMGLTIQKVLEKPTIRTVFRGNEKIAFSAISILVTRFLQSFGFSTKPDPSKIEMIAVDTFEKFSYESLEDIILFFKMARSGDFGATKRGVDSNLIFGEWFPMYLERKAILREENNEKQKNNLNDIGVSYEDVKITYKKAHEKKFIERLEAHINAITKDFDRQMLEDLIIDWEKDSEKKIYVKYLKVKRKQIK